MSEIPDAAASLHAEQTLELIRIRAELAEMRADRDLWQQAHDEDCPNLAALEATQSERDEFQLALEKIIEDGNQDSFAYGVAEAALHYLQKGSQT